MGKARMAAATLFLLCGLALAAPTGASARARGVDTKMLGAVNAVRAQHGLRALALSSSLSRSARAYAGWMMRNSYFGHLPHIRASSRFRYLGENLAWHSGLSPAVRGTVRQWMLSPQHRAVMLSRGFRWLGSGMSRGSYGGGLSTMWVLHLGA